MCHDASLRDDTRLRRDVSLVAVIMHRRAMKTLSVLIATACMIFVLYEPLARQQAENAKTTLRLDEGIENLWNVFFVTHRKNAESSTHTFLEKKNFFLYTLLLQQEIQRDIFE